MKKTIKVMSVALAFVCLCLCLTGCSLFGNSDNSKNRELESITLKTTLEQTYCLNDTLDLSSNRLILIYSNGTQEEVVINDSWITKPFDSTSVGNKQMIINYNEKIYKLNYTVVNGIRVNGSILKMSTYCPSQCIYVSTSDNTIVKEEVVDSNHTMYGTKIKFLTKNTLELTSKSNTGLTTSSSTYKIRDGSIYIYETDGSNYTTSMKIALLDSNTIELTDEQIFTYGDNVKVYTKIVFEYVD